LPMCAMCVGASFFLLRVGEKNKINSSNLHCPVKKLNPFFRYYLSLSYLSARLSFYTCCQRLGVWQVWESGLRFRPPTKTTERAKPLRSSSINPHWLHPLLVAGDFLVLIFYFSYRQ
jgi:hypothetical protein